MTLALPVGAGTETAISYQGSTPADYLIPQGKTISPDNRPDEAGYSRNLLRNQFEELEAKQVSQVGYGRRAWHRGRMGDWHSIGTNAKSCDVRFIAYLAA